MWLILACGIPDEPGGCESDRSLCDQGGDDTGDSSIDDTALPAHNVCHNGDTTVVESGYEDEEGVHFHWEVEQGFIDSGGVLPDEDAASVIAQCPVCTVLGTKEFLVQVDRTDDKGRGLGFSYGTLLWLCEND